MSFINPGACDPCHVIVDGEDCCSVTFTGFCLEDGTPIGIVVQEEEQIGWFNFETGVFTPGPPPPGTQICPSPPLDCATDSITACPQAAAMAANLSAATIPVGVAIVTRPGDWAVSDAPAAAVAASASKAPVVGARHVATAISFIICAESATAPTATNLTVTLRDGATAAGTVLMVWRIHVAADMLSENIAQVTLGGLNVIGSVNTAMTLEFNAGVINTLETVNLTGYTVA